jgi:hypothetical protein
MSKLFLSGIVLGAATLVATLAFAGDYGLSRLPDETPMASAADASAPYVQSDAPKENGVPAAAVSELPRPSKSLDIDVKIDGNGIRLGGRLSGSKGVSGAWLGAQLRDDGVTLDGRLEGNDGPPRDFKLNLDLLPGWARTAARIWLMLP